MTSKNQWRWHVKHLESFRNHICPQVWSLVLLITALGVGAVVGVGARVGAGAGFGLRQEDLEFKAILDYIMGSVPAWATY